MSIITGILLVSLYVLLVVLPFVVITVLLVIALRRFLRTPKGKQRTRSLLLLIMIALVAAAAYGVWFDLHVSS